MVLDLDLTSLEVIDSSNPHTIRVYAQTNWSLHECIILQDAKHRDHDCQADGGAYEAMQKGVDRWTLVEDTVCFGTKVGTGVHRMQG